MKTSVLVLGGGPDPERDVSLQSSRAVTDALTANGHFAPVLEVIDRPTAAQLRAMSGEVIWPVLHGRYGEGGPMQSLLEADGRPFVGCAARASRIAIDKIHTKTIARQLGMHVTPTALFDPADPSLPMDLPCVIKPVFEGSTIGLFVCRTEDEWRHAHAMTVASGRACMVEPYTPGRELTVGLIGGQGALRPLPIIEIVPAGGLYDYEAKYTRDDTRYEVNPDLPAEVSEQINRWSVELAEAIGIRHLARVDYMFSADGHAWLLEANTMPGFTGHSLVPMAAAATGMTMPELCGLLVDLAVASQQHVSMKDR